MKLILSSAGFTTQEIVDKCVALVGKPKEHINFAVINEAYAVEQGNHRWVIDDLNNIKDNFRGNIELINLLALDIEIVEERIDKADAIFVVGGHTDYLMNVFNKTGFSKLLPKLLEQKVYIGSSAGSMVLGNRVSTKAYERIFGEKDDFGVTEYLGLVSFALKPHLDSKLFPSNRENVLKQVTNDYDGIVYSLRDDSAIVIDGEKEYTIGSEPLKIVDDNKHE